MYKAKIDVNKKDYFECSMYYIKKYISLRELILLGVLFAAALLFWFSFENIIIFIMFAIVLLLMGLAVMLFVFTALAGYKTDYVKFNIKKQILTFYETDFCIDSFDDKDRNIYKEKIEYKNVDKVALRKNKVYIYGGVALPFYIFPDSMIEGDYGDFRMFLINHIEQSKFKMKTRVRHFPNYSKKKFDQDLQEKLDRINDSNKDKNNPKI